MPLLHQDNSRGGGGSENRRSLAEFLGFESSPLGEPAAAPTLNNRANECVSDEWRWAQPGSPEAAQTPRALVPSACFPPRHTTAYTSYSESAQPGSLWSAESASGGLTDLVASLECVSDEWRWAQPGSPEAAQTPRALVPSACFPPRHTTAYTSYSESAQPGSLWSAESASGGLTDLVASLKALATPSGSRALCERLERLEPRPLRSTAARDQRAALLPRRASFCGVVSRGSSGGEMLSWGGKLPPRCAEPSGGFSAKVFLGGLPWDITEQSLMNALRHFQPIRVEWPGRECAGGGASGAPRGYAYVTFESERRVRALLAASRRDNSDWYYRIGSRKMRTKEVQVIPWALADSNWVVGGSVRLEPARTVFVGALHGMLSASALATIMNDLFSGVVYAGIDTDKYKYPIGSGRVTFNNVRSYVRAISAAYIEIQTDKFTKKVQVNPYLEDSMCSVCNLQQGPYFCREPTCFGYFCRSCWSWQHATDNHKPLMRNSKGAAGARALSPRQSPTDHANTFNGGFSGPNEGTPSPATSGTSASDAEQGGAGEEAVAEGGWVPRPLTAFGAPEEAESSWPPRTEAERSWAGRAHALAAEEAERSWAARAHSDAGQGWAPPQ